MLTPEAQKQVDSMLLKDLRVELRSRGLNPAGGAEALRERLTESIVGGAAPLSRCSSELARPMCPAACTSNLAFHSSPLNLCVQWPSCSSHGPRAHVKQLHSLQRPERWQFHHRPPNLTSA